MLRRSSRPSPLLLATLALCLHTAIHSVNGGSVTTGCGGNPADVVFLLDASNSIWRPDFRRQLQFVRDVIDWFTIGREAMRVSLVTYADQPQVQVYLHQYDSKTDIQAAIDNVRQSGGYHTHTGDALRYIRETIFAGDAARRSYPRPSNVTRVGVIITDGLSDDRVVTAAEAKLTKETGIHLFGVGVGSSVDLEELEAIASHPTQDYTFLVENYEALSHIRELLAIKTCTVTDPPTTTTITTTTTQPTTTTKRRVPVIIEQPAAHRRPPSKNTKERHHAPGRDIAELKGRDISIALPSGVGGNSTAHGGADKHDVDVDENGTGFGGNETGNGNRKPDEAGGRSPSFVGGGGGADGEGENRTIRIAGEFPIGDTWLWRYDEHGVRIWYRIRSGPESGDDDPESTGLPIFVAPLVLTPPTTLPPSPPPIGEGPTRTPGHGYWVVGERGEYVWFRFDESGQYRRDPLATVGPDEDVDGAGPKLRVLTWTGIGDWYWSVERSDANRTYYQLSRIGLDVFELTGPTEHWDGRVGPLDESAPHVYLSSGPGGRGGYWAIDEHRHYVWYNYVGPNHFEKDESTAVDLHEAYGGGDGVTGDGGRGPFGEIGPDGAAAHRPSASDRRPYNPHNRRRPGPPTRRPLPTTTRARPTTTTTASATTTTTMTARPTSGDAAGGRGSKPVDRSRVRGYWITDEFGRLTWHTYEIDEEEEVVVERTTPTRPTTTPTTTTSSSTTTTTKRPTTREVVNGHWTRDVRGRLVWRTFGPTNEVTEALSTSPSPTTTTTEATTTTTPPYVRVWWPAPTTTATKAREPSGYWIRDKWSGRMIWVRHTTKIPDTTTRTTTTTTTTRPTTTTTTTTTPSTTTTTTTPSTTTTTTPTTTTTTTEPTTTTTQPTTTTIDYADYEDEVEVPEDSTTTTASTTTTTTTEPTSTRTSTTRSTPSTTRTPSTKPSTTTTTTTTTMKTTTSTAGKSDDKQVDVFFDLTRHQLVWQGGPHAANRTFVSAFVDKSWDDLLAVAAGANVSVSGPPADLDELWRLLVRLNETSSLSPKLVDRLLPPGQRDRVVESGGVATHYWYQNKNGTRTSGMVRRNMTGTKEETAWNQFITPTRRRPGQQQPHQKRQRIVPQTADGFKIRHSSRVPAHNDRRRLNGTARVCNPRRPVDLVFAVDLRSPTASHVRTLWQISFEVISGLHMDEDRVRVRFVPDGAHNMQTPGGGVVNSIPSLDRYQIGAATANRSASAPTTSTKTVADVVGELVKALKRRPDFSDEVFASAPGRRIRRVGIYVTDGRSPDTAGTVRAVARSAGSLAKRVDLIAVGVGPEVSGAQLAAVARGRRDRLLTVFTDGASGSQSSVKDVSDELVRIICRRR